MLSLPRVTIYTMLVYSVRSTCNLTFRLAAYGGVSCLGIQTDYVLHHVVFLVLFSFHLIILWLNYFSFSLLPYISTIQGVTATGPSPSPFNFCLS